MRDEIIAFTERSKDEIAADIKQLAPQLQEHRLRGRPGEAASVERRLYSLYEELRAARARDDNPAADLVDGRRKLIKALFLDGRRNGDGRA